MTIKNITKRKKVFAFVCTVLFLGEAILFVLNATTDYKTYTDSKVVKADVINVSGTKNGMLDVKYRYNYDGGKYEESVRQSVGEIKVGDEKEIRIRKNTPKQIITTSIKSAILQNIAFAFCLVGYVLTVLYLYEMATSAEEEVGMKNVGFTTTSGITFSSITEENTKKNIKE